MGIASTERGGGLGGACLRGGVDGMTALFDKRGGSTSRGYYPHFVDTIHIGHITSYLARNFRHVLHS